MATDTVLRSSGVTTTILGVLNQFHAFTNLRYTAMHETTLNHKYGVNDIEIPEYSPTLKYFGIGTRGYKNTDDEQGALPYPGDARCMDLYRPIPIRCIRSAELDTVLPLAERSKYRMKTTRIVDEVEYTLFYLKLIEFNDSVEIVKKDADGIVSEYPLSPDTWLNPNPPEMNQTGGNINTNINRIIVRATGKCRVDHDEIMEAVSVLYNGDMNFARISEIGYYTGYDTEVTSAAGEGQSATTYEAAYVQLAKHHCFRGSELFTKGSYIEPIVSLESECCINGY